MNKARTFIRKGNITLFAFLAFITPLLAQTDSIPKPLKYSQIIYTDSVKATELYERARLWFAQTFNNSKAVLQITDKESGELVGKAVMRYNSSIFIGSQVTSGWISYLVKVNVKDGRYKYEIAEFIHIGTASSGADAMDFGLITNGTVCPVSFGKAIEPQKWKNNVWEDLKQTIRENVPLIILSLQTAMTKPTANAQDW